MAIVTPEESEAPDEKRLTSQPQETFTFYPCIPLITNKLWYLNNGTL